jgi:hypothetical protein
LVNERTAMGVVRAVTAKPTNASKLRAETGADPAGLMHPNNY